MNINQKKRFATLGALALLISTFALISCGTTETTSVEPDGVDTNLYLWCATETKLANIYAANGRLIRAFDAPGNEPSGMAFDGDCLWSADNQTGLLYRIELSYGIPIVTMNIPRGVSYGLAWDGENLWNIHNSLEKIETYSGGILASYNISGSGLAWDGHNLWTSHNEYIFGDIDYYQCYLDKINPGTGNITESILFSSERCDYPAQYDNTNIKGLAWHDGDIWYSMAHTKYLAHDPDDPFQGGTYAYDYYIGYFDLSTQTEERLYKMDFPLSGVAGNAP